VLEEGAQGALEMVHCRTYAVPAVPLKVVVGEEAFAKDPPAPLTMVQSPVPITGVLAARVTVVRPQVEALVWLGPATDAVGAWLKVTFIVLDDGVQGALDMVQASTYGVPAAPLNVVVGEEAFAKDPPAPLTMVQSPVPTAGVFPASVTIVSPQVAAFI